MVGWVGRWMERRKGERDAGKKGAGRLAEMLKREQGFRPGEGGGQGIGTPDLNHLFGAIS